MIRDASTSPVPTTLRRAELVAGRGESPALPGTTVGVPTMPSPGSGPVQSFTENRLLSRGIRTSTP